MRPNADDHAVYRAVLDAAVEAYRQAAVHRCRVFGQLEVGYEKRSRLSEFSRQRVAAENASYWATEIHDYARDVLCAVIRREVPLEPVRILDCGERAFRKIAPKRAQHVFDAVDAVRATCGNLARQKV